MATKTKLTIEEKINRSREGKSQTYIVGKMRDTGLNITEVIFSRKKKGHERFTTEELDTLSQILGTEITE